MKNKNQRLCLVELFPNSRYYTGCSENIARYFRSMFLEEMTKKL